MGSLLNSLLMYNNAAIVDAGAGPRRMQSRRTDLPNRSGRALVTRSAPDHAAQQKSPGGVGVLVRPAMPARPFQFYTVPRSRLGTVPKLAPGKQGSGLGQTVRAGFVSEAYPGFTPLDYAPDTQPDRGIGIPKTLPAGVAPVYGKTGFMPSYNPHDFAPAQRFFMQNRSSARWAQTSFPPQIRALTPSQQAVQLKRPAMFARRQIPAGQPNLGLYAFGYPTSVGIAARLGGGPIAVLGGNSQ